MATPSIRRPDLPAGLSYEKPDPATAAPTTGVATVQRPALPDGLSYERPTPAVAAPTLKQPRSWARAAGDLGVGLLEGGVSAGLAIPQLANTLTGGAIDEAWKPLTGAVDRLAGGPGEGRTLAQSSQDTRAALDELKSPQLRAAEQDLANTKGFLPSAKAILTNPMLLGQQVAEQVPQFIVPAGAARKVGASVLEKVGAEALAKGTAKRVAAGLGEQEAAQLALPAANRLAQRAASKAAGRAVMATGGAIGASQASEQAQQEVMGLDQSVMDANPEYRQMRAQGLSDADARQKLAITAGMKAAAIALPFDTLTSGLSARLEGNIFRGQTGVQGLSQLLSKRGAAGVAKAAGKEGAEETLQEGGEQFAQNVGVQGVDPNKSLMDQVPEQAALGGTIGAVLGAGGFAGSSALSRPSAHAAPPGSLTDAANVLSQPANGPIGRAAQEGVANGAVAAAAQAANPPAEAPSAQSTRVDPGVAPWADPTTGELANPSPADLIRALADHMVAQHQATGDMRINAQQIAEAWGVPKGAVERTRKAATTMASDQLAAAERAAMAPPAAAPAEPEPGTTASIPFMITQQMRADLRALGHTDAEIAGMTPEQANTLLQAGQSVATAPQETTDDERVPEPAPAAPAGAGAAPAGATDEQPAAGGEPQPPAGSGAATQPAPDSATAVAGERAAADAIEALNPPSKEAPADAETPASAAPAPGPGGNPAAVAGDGGAAAAGAAPADATAPTTEAEPKAPVTRAPKAPKGSAATPANHVHAAIQRIAEGEHPEKVLADADDATVRAVGAAMGKRFSTKAPVSAMVERIGETAASDRRRLAADALVKLGRQKAAEAPPLKPEPSPAPRSTQSVAARKAESLRVKTPSGEVNGRSHVDHLIRDGYTHLASTRAGDKLVHSLAKPDGTSEKIHARQLAYAQERLAYAQERLAKAEPTATPEQPAEAPATVDKRQQIEDGFAENKAAIAEHKFKAGDAVTFAQNGKTITGTIAKGDKAGMVKDMGVFEVEHPGRDGMARTTIGARFLTRAEPAADKVAPPAAPTTEESSAVAPAAKAADLAEKVEAAADSAASSPNNDKSEPTQAQKEAGNYEKGHVSVQGLDISIENPRGSTRSGVGENGKPWSHVMTDHYGYIRRTEGADGEQVDVYVGPNPASNHVYVVDQLDQKTGGFDEHKSLIGFDSEAEAVKAYRGNFDKGWKVGPVHAMSMDEFKGWLKDGDTTRPAGERAAVPPPSSAMSDADFTAHLPAYVAQYRELAASKTGNPDYFNADLAKEMFPEYNASKETRRDNNENVSPRASKIAFTAFQQRLAEKPTEAGATATLMAGGTGSGKSVLKPAHGIVYDSTMYDTAAAKRNVQLVLDSGRDVEYRYVFTEPDSAFRAAIARGKDGGRYVNMTAFVRTHEGAYKAVQALMKDYAGNDRVQFIQYDNTDFAQREIEALPVFDYNGLREHLQAILDEEHAAGNVSAAEYRAIARTEPPARSDAGVAGRGSRADQDGRPEQSEGLVAPSQTPPPGGVSVSTADDSRFKNNTVFTADKVAAARARLKSKLGTINAGIDPEVLLDGLTIAGAYIESGVRGFGAYAKAMIADLGDGVRPFLRSFYESVRHYPGFDSAGMSTPQETERLHAQMLQGTEDHPAMGEQPKPAKRKPAASRKAGAPIDRTLTQDWGVDQIDGYTALPGRPFTQTDNGMAGGVKDAFLKETKSYLKAVSEALIRAGYREYEGKARAVSVNASGPVTSGDVTLVLRKPGGDGVYVHISDSSLRGVVPGSKQGISVMFRAVPEGDKYGAKGVNQWAPTDLTAGELADLINNQLNRATAATRQAATDERQAAPASRTEPARSAMGEADSQGSAPAGKGQLGASESGPAQADLAGMDSGQPEDAGAAQGNRPELSERPGARAAGPDVGDAEGTDRQRDGSDGRARAGGARNADVGAGKHAGSKRAGRGTSRDAGARAAVDDPAVVKPPAEVSPANPGPGNYHMDDPLAVVGGGQVARFNKNQAAIELFNKLRDESRKPTAEEQAVLAGYTGWGSFGQELFQGNWNRPAPKDGWQARDAWLRENLGQSEWESVQRSITNAHYTDPPTVMAMWAMVQRMGFTGGRVLEPSMGIGNFFAMMPRELADRSKLSGIELDEVTGGMAKLLYPDANVHVMGYQDSKTPDSFHDVIIGNWPFENTPVADRRYQRLNPMVHDYFFLKALDQVRPGGLVVGITSKGTMDKKAVGIRAELARKGELVAAFRLPSGAFEEYAGTKVVTDIIILRKRAEPIGNPMEQGWIDSKEYMTPQGEPVFLNEYYHAHPEHVIGTIEYVHGTTQGRAGMIVTRPDDMHAQLARIVASVPEGAYRADTRADHISYITNHTKDREGSLTASDGKFYVVRGEQLAPAEQVRKYSGSNKAETVAREDQLTRLIGMRRQYADLIAAERTPSADPTRARATLKASYDSYVKDHGQLNKSFGLDYLRRIDDPFYYSLAALEIQTGGRGKTATYRPAQILTESTTRARAVVKNPSITDAFVIARNRSVNPTLAEIAEIANKTPDQVRAELIGKGTIYELPGGDIVPADIYLSGNVREKLRQARAAVEVEGNTALQRNVDALEKVVPADIPYYKIETQFGATWVSIENYKAYIAHMLGTDSTDGIDVSYNAGRWRVRLDDKLKNRPEYRANFGTVHTGFRALVQAAISNQTITIRVKDRDGNLVADPEATKEVTEKIANIRGSFGDWLWSDAERKVAAEREYNEVRNAYATPHFDGSFLGFEGMALSLGRGPFDLREHQRNAIWRALVTRKSLNAHEVGTGKTFTMGGIAVESRRYGIAKKPLLLAHNANSKSVAAEIQQMYPAAKVLYIDNLAPDAIDVKMRQIANDDWDTIVMPHSLIDRLSFKEETLMGMAKEEIAELEQAAAEAAEDDDTKLTPEMLDDEEALKKLRSPTAKELVKMRNRIIATIKKQAQRSSRDGAISFEELGIDQLLVDEAHEFKKPPFSTKMKMKGLQTQASDKAIALSFMSKYVRGQNNGGNVHLFTGTPVTNTMTEVFHMMRYIMQEEMQSAGVDQWDGWFGSFAREVQDVELNAAAEYEAVTRLAAFINVPELRRMIGQYMDVVFSDDMPEMRPRRTVSGKTMADALDPAEQAELLNGRTEGAQDRPYKKVVIDTADLTPAQAAAFEDIQGYAKRWRNFTKKERKAAMLSGAKESPIIYEGLANKASLDSRLLHGEALAGQEGQARDDAASKASRVVKNVLEIYNSHPQANQVIFSDLGMGTVATRSVGAVGKKTQQRYKVFSTLRDVIERLVAGGIPREQIALVDGSTSKDKRKEIADKVNTGAIRVVIGSSGSLGVGVNMQRNLRAMHHLDAPWMPGDLEQRNGRGQRQGNQWNTVLEYRYLTDRLDGRRWQVLAIKDRFIKSFLKANDTDRVIEGDAASDEQSDILQTFSEAAGDPRILIREKIKKKIESLQSKERLHGRAMADNQASIRRLNSELGTRRGQLASAERDQVEAQSAAIVAANAGSNFRMKVNGKKYDKRADADEAIKDWASKNVVAGQRRVTIGEYGGHRLFVRQGSFDPTPTLSMEFGDTVVEGRAGTVASMDMALRNLPAKLQKQRDELAATEQSLDRMKKTVGEPFHMADQLAAQQKALADLERDIEINPVPPPAWLRQGAPVDTETFWNGKPYTVTGHRWTDEGWYVMGEGPEGEVQIPYTEAKDKQGIAQYEERPFQSPKVLTEAERKAADGSQPPAVDGGNTVSFRLDDATAAPASTASQAAHTARVKALADELTRTWQGDDVPRVQVVATPEHLPASAKRNPQTGLPDDSYKNAAGMYDGRTVWIVASRHPDNAEGRAKIARTLAHEAVGHYGIDRIVTRELGAQAWTKIEDNFDRLRRDRSLGSTTMRSVLDSVERRYRQENGAPADRRTFAREALAVMSERGVHNGLLARAVAAVRAFLRRFMPDMKLSEADLRRLLAKSREYIERGETRGQRVQSRAAVAFNRESQTDTPAFREFFGDSKVVDAEGNPLPVYHGTAEEFDTFDPNRSGSTTAHMTANLGTFFAEDRAKAQHYAENASQGVPAEERVIDAYLSIRKPYTMSLKQFMGIDSQEESAALRAKLIKEGYDGIHIPEVQQWIAFRPNQIKSASENRGTFDASTGNIYFSRDDADPDNPNPTPRPFGDASASIEALYAELPQLDRSAFQKGKDWIAGKARDFEPAALGALQLRHVLELAADDPTLKGPAKAYADLYQRMDGDRNQLLQSGAEKVDALQKWARKPGAAGWLSGKVRPEAVALFKFMHAVTQLAVDPTNAYEKLLMRDAGNEYKPWTKDLIKERIKVLRKTALTRSGDDKTRIYDEIKQLESLPARERVRQERYPKLVAQWNALSPEAKHHFEVMRDHYQEQSAALEEATVQQLNSLDIPDQNKRTAIQMVRNNFRDAKVDGVYFPLTRFGDYWISLRKADGEYVFAKYETANAMAQAEKQWLAAGATIEARGRQDNNYRAKDAPSGTFIGDLMGILKNAPDKTKDEIYQMYLKTLPALSLRKHGIHRSNVAGYSDDVPRAFASSVFHGAHQISKARYGWRLQSTLEQMRERMEARRTVINASQAAHGDALLGELARRHDWVMNPTNSQLASKLTSIGFSYYLAASPASALVNLIQVPQIVLPVLSAQHGWGRTTRVLSATMRDAIRTGGHIDKVLTGEDLQAFKALAEQGTFQRSAAHALASISEGDQLRASPVYTRVMNAVSWMFHTSEVINREGTGMAAFRLARAKGMAFDAAVKYADEITNGTHGDYSNANRARYMQGNTMKVLTQFKNYSLAMSWLWGRQFHQAFKGESPEVRATARRTLTGLLGMTGLFAGVVGMPIFNLLRYGAMAAHAVTGDPDEPWDFMTEFRAWLSEHLGDTAADLIANGAASQLGANVASRVSMSDLWFRDADRQLEGEDAYNAMLQSIAGPLGGMIKNMYVGAQQFNEGHTERGLETMLPTFAKNAVKAVRYASQGVNTLRGDPIVADISGPEALIQAIGFQPTRVAQQQRLNNSLYTYQAAIKERRQALMNGFAMAQQAGDVDGRVEALRRIRAFNAKNPEVAIGIANLRASLQGRARFSADASHGIRLDKKLAARLRQEVGASP